MRRTLLPFLAGVAVMAAIGIVAWRRDAPPPLLLSYRAAGSEAFERQFVLETSARTITFGSVGSSPTGDLRAVIRVTEGATVREVALPGEYDGRYWEQVVRSRSSPRIVAVAEYGIGGPGWELPIAASDDGGATWFHAATIRKPYYQAMFDRLRLDANGRGSLILFIDDYGQGDETRSWSARVRAWWAGEPPPMPNRPGFYEWRTRDHGRTWTGPVVHEDDLERLSEDVP